MSMHGLNQNKSLMDTPFAELNYDSHKVPTTKHKNNLSRVSMNKKFSM